MNSEDVARHLLNLKKIAGNSGASPPPAKDEKSASRRVGIKKSRRTQAAIDEIMKRLNLAPNYPRHKRLVKYYDVDENGAQREEGSPASRCPPLSIPITHPLPVTKPAPSSRRSKKAAAPKAPLPPPPPPPLAPRTGPVPQPPQSSASVVGVPLESETTRVHKSAIESLLGLKAQEPREESPATTPSAESSDSELAIGDSPTGVWECLELVASNQFVRRSTTRKREGEGKFVGEGIVKVPKRNEAVSSH